MSYEIIVSRELCESNAECVAMAPEVFGLDADDFCVVVDPEAARDKKILDAARACPVDAIILIDRYGEQVWP